MHEAHKNHRHQCNLPNRIFIRTIPRISKCVMDGVRFYQAILPFTKIDLKSDEMQQAKNARFKVVS